MLKTKIYGSYNITVDAPCERVAGLPKARREEIAYYVLWPYLGGSNADFVPDPNTQINAAFWDNEWLSSHYKIEYATKEGFGTELGSLGVELAGFRLVKFRLKPGFSDDPSVGDTQNGFTELINRVGEWSQFEANMPSKYRDGSIWRGIYVFGPDGWTYSYDHHEEQMITVEIRALDQNNWTPSVEEGRFRSSLDRFADTHGMALPDFSEAHISIHTDYDQPPFFIDANPVRISEEMFAAIQSGELQEFANQDYETDYWWSWEAYVL